MSSIDDLEEEIENLKDVIDAQKRDMDALRDEKDQEIADLEFQIESVRAEVTGDFKMRMKLAEKDFREQLSSVNKELDTLRNAFSGDTGGWELKVSKRGDEFYENKETGEVRETEPEVLWIANAMKKIEDAEANAAELIDIRAKLKELDIKKKEADIAINKMKTEMNALKSMERGWKESAKAVFKNLIHTKELFDNQFDQIDRGLGGVVRFEDRMMKNIPNMRKIKPIVAHLQETCKQQEGQIRDLKSNVTALVTDVDDKAKKIERLSKGFATEIERLCKPMRERVSECMLAVMKEKAARAQERREIADLWPEGFLMPTLLMKSRSLTENEKTYRKQRAAELQASMALSIEIRANITEMKQWEIKYDDYGRPFYMHSKTGETLWEEPPILSYKPPPGRDEMGNLIDAEDMAAVRALTTY